MTAFIPEPQTLLMVMHGVLSGSPALIAACRAGRLPDACRDDAAHDHFIHGVRLDAGAFERGFDGGGPEVGRGDVFERTAERADGRAGSRKDDGSHAISD